jgi:prolyl-tRNA editing enzyme YbaK/EbsC (Cys-tRNA(Pro) deacylase)
MSVPKQVIAHLNNNKVKFEVVPHRTVYTAYDLAQTLGEKLENIAKTLLVKVELPKVSKDGKKYYVVAVPASYRVDLKAVQKYLKATKAVLADEKEMIKLGMVAGAGTPFVSMYKDVGLIVDKSLEKAAKGLVRAESLTESLRMKIKDLVKSESALVAKVGSKAKMPKAPKAKKPTKKPQRKFATKAAYKKSLKTKKVAKKRK